MSSDAVDPHASVSGKPTTRDKSSSSSSETQPPTSTESFWQKYATGPREDGQLEAEAQVRALKGTAPMLLADWVSTV